MFQTKFAEKIKTHILCTVTFFLENRAVCEIMWENTAERGRPQMTIWRSLIACRIHKATNAHSEYVILIAFPLERWLHERSSPLDCLCTACLQEPCRLSFLARCFFP